MSTAKRLLTDKELEKYLELREKERSHAKANKYLESLQEELWITPKK